MNYDKVICELFGDRLSLQHNLSFALQFTKLNIEQIATLQKYQIPGHIDALDARLNDALTEEQKSDLEYQFRVVYTLDSTTKNKSHFKFLNPNSDEAEQIRNILVKYKTADAMYPHKPSEVVKFVKERSDSNFTSRNHTQAWRRFDVRPRGGVGQPDTTNEDYCIYHPAYKSYTYSEKWIEFLLSKIRVQQDYDAIKCYQL